MTDMEGDMEPLTQDEALRRAKIAGFIHGPEQESAYLSGFTAGRGATSSAAPAPSLDVELARAAQVLVDALPYEGGSMLGGKIALVVAALSKYDRLVMHE